MALVLPGDEKTSVAVAVPMLLLGDICALALHARYPDWRELRKLLPLALVGVAVGYFVLSIIDDRTMKAVLGAAILCLLGLEVFRIRFKKQQNTRNNVVSCGIRVAVGASSTVSNAAGPLISIYLVSIGLKPQAFIGTAAVLFLVLNSVKVLLFLQMGLLQGEVFAVPEYWVLLAIVVAGIFVGRSFAARLNTEIFRRLVLTVAGVAALWLVVTATGLL